VAHSTDISVNVKKQACIKSPRDGPHPRCQPNVGMIANCSFGLGFSSTLNMYFSRKVSNCSLDRGLAGNVALHRQASLDCRGRFPWLYRSKTLYMCRQCGDPQRSCLFGDLSGTRLSGWNK
jgi:hypothetical protein